MAAERRLLEKARHELVTFDLVNVLLSQSASSLHAKPAGARLRHSLDDLGAVCVVADDALLLHAVTGGVIVCHLPGNTVVMTPSTADHYHHHSVTAAAAAAAADHGD